MDRRYRALVVAACLIATACNDHDLLEFKWVSPIDDVQRTDSIYRHPVDILLVIDNTASMCEAQAVLGERLDTFIGALVSGGIDFQIAIVNTDATELIPGAFRTGPGTFEASSCASPPDTSLCAGRNLPTDGIIKSSTYTEVNSDTPTTFQRLHNDLRCLALTGIDGNSPGMGLENLRQALRNNPEFIRPNALLAVIFVTDGNDCSDGTIGLSTFGSVYEEILSTQNNTLCETQRNIEDSCILSAKNAIPLIVTSTVTNDDGTAVEVIESRTGLEWCTFGDRAIVESLVASGDIEVNCPPEGCANRLINRREFYNALTTEIGKKPEDVIIASIINPDSGARYSAEEIENHGQIPSACGVADALGYRYELFTNMFLDKQRVVGAICEAGRPKFFAENLGLIAETIGLGTNSVCLESPPSFCTYDGTGDAPCPEGQFCCPQSQLCGRLADAVDCTGLSESECIDAEARNVRIFFEGTPNEYKLCSGFRVVVGETQEDGSLVEYKEGVDFWISYTSAAKCGVETPLEILFRRAPSNNVVVIFPQALRKNLGMLALPSGSE